MRNIIPALNKLQLACQDTSVPMSELGQARKELFAAIREAIVGLPMVDITTGAGNPALVKAQAEYLAKFDKLNGD